MNVSYFGSNPLKLQPNFPIIANNLDPYNCIQKEDLDTKSHSKGNKQYEIGEESTLRKLKFEPDFKLLNNKFMNSLKKDSNGDCHKSNSSPPFNCVRHQKL